MYIIASINFIYMHKHPPFNYNNDVNNNNKRYVEKRTPLQSIPPSFTFTNRFTFLPTSARNFWWTYRTQVRWLVRTRDIEATMQRYCVANFPQTETTRPWSRKARVNPTLIRATTSRELIAGGLSTASRSPRCDFVQN